MASAHAGYHEKDTLANTVKTMSQTTLAGVIFAGAQNSLQRQNVGAFGIFTRSGAVIAQFGTVILRS